METLRIHGGCTPLQKGMYPIIVPIMGATETLLHEIEAFGLEVGVSPSTLARKAINDGKLPARLRAGGKVTLETAERLRSFMRDYRKPDHGRAA